MTTPADDGQPTIRENSPAESASAESAPAESAPTSDASAEDSPTPAPSPADAALQPAATADNAQKQSPDFWFQELAFYSVSAGVATLIPVPFLDDYVLRLTRRSLFTRQLNRLHTDSSTKVTDFLANGPKEFKFGCLTFPFYVLKKLIFWPIRKLLRKILIFLAIKDCINEASYTFHLGYITRYLIQRGYFPLSSQSKQPSQPDSPLPDQPASISLEQAEALREDALAILDQVDTRPITMTMKSAFRRTGKLLRAARNGITSLGRKKRQEERATSETPDASIQQELPPKARGAVEVLADRVASLLWARQGYFTTLEQACETHQKTKSQPPKP